MTRPRPSRGFTLIELLVVIAIIAVLIALLLPDNSNVRKASNALAQFPELAPLAGAVNEQADGVSRDLQLVQSFLPAVQDGQLPDAETVAAATSNLRRDYANLSALDLETVHMISAYAHSPNEKQALIALHKQLAGFTEGVGRLQDELQHLSSILQNLPQ